jgi:hypothetical protein
MTKESQPPKQNSLHHAKARGGRWNPIRIDKPLLQATQPPALAKSLGDEDATAIDSAAPMPALLPKKPRRRFIFSDALQNLPIRLPSWKVLALIGFLGAGAVSGTALFRPSALPNCPSIFWPMASASLRLYCAQLAANKQTPQDLLEAIALVKSLPADHPLQTEVKKYLEEWSQDLLEVANDLFNQGRLLDAVQAAAQIPADTPEATQAAQKRVKEWQDIWTDAVKTFQDAEAELREGNWRIAFRIGSRLTFVGNTYWETTKFEELNRAVKQNRQDITSFWEARDLAELGGVSNLLESIRKLELIPSNSYLTAKVLQEKIKVGDQLLTLAEASLERQDLQETLNIVAQVPNVGNLGPKAHDLGALANAQAKAWSDSSRDLQESIALAQQIGPTSPYRDRAQKLIARWQSILTALPVYEQAQQLAALGQLENYRAAIDQANSISRDNPVWKKVSGSIEEWKEQIALLEDRPILDTAIRTAQSTNISDLESAIATASQIQPNRPLYSEARDRIQSWTIQVQQSQDQPIVDQARAIANQGDLASAIAVAKQVQPGRALSSEAQGLVSGWQSEINGQRNLAIAQQSARANTVEGLVSAIQAANQVPRSSSSYSQSLQLLDQWSNDLLRAADQAAGYNLRQAIEIAKRIPQSANNYGIAQEQIRSWREALAPPPAPPPEPIVAPPVEQSAPYQPVQPQTDPATDPGNGFPEPQPVQ